LTVAVDVAGIVETAAVAARNSVVDTGKMSP
jgi:hypothetical protein